jgi:hypothetical protein
MTQAEVTSETQTGTADIAAAVTAERFAPQPRDPHRAQVVAAIHAYAEWLAQNPDVPLPDSLEATRYNSGSEDGPEAIEQVRHMINVYGGTRQASGNSGWSTYRVMDKPLKVEHTVFCGRPGTREDSSWI